MPDPLRKISIGIVAYNLTDQLRECIASCVSLMGYEVTVHLFDHSPHPAVNAVCEAAGRGEIIGTDGKPVNVKLHSHKRNRGLCVGWNEALLHAYLGDCSCAWTTANCKSLPDDSDTVCILVNDDVVFDGATDPTDRDVFFNQGRPVRGRTEPDDATARIGWEWDRKSDVDRLAQLAHAHRQYYAWTVLGYNKYYTDHPSRHPDHEDSLAGPWVGIGWSCLAINPVFLRTVGMFDENLVPIYHEDEDAGWRAYLQGLQMAELKQTRVLHYGSLHWRVDPDAHAQNTGNGPAAQALNRYFERKWRWSAGENRFKIPFNHQPFDLFIGPEKRHRPYGGLFDRTDIKQVIKL